MEHAGVSTAAGFVVAGNGISSVEQEIQESKWECKSVTCEGRDSLYHSRCLERQRNWVAEEEVGGGADEKNGVKKISSPVSAAAAAAVAVAAAAVAAAAVARENQKVPVAVSVTTTSCTADGEDDDEVQYIPSPNASGISPACGKTGDAFSPSSRAQSSETSAQHPSGALGERLAAVNEGKPLVAGATGGGGSVGVSPGIDSGMGVPASLRQDFEMAVKQGDHGEAGEAAAAADMGVDAAKVEEEVAAGAPEPSAGVAIQRNGRRGRKREGGRWTTDLLCPMCYAIVVPEEKVVEAARRWVGARAMLR